MTRKEIIVQMLKEDLEEHIAVSTWNAKDVFCYAESLEMYITKEEANKIIDQIHVECKGGPIDWDTIEDSVIQFYESLDGWTRINRMSNKSK